MNKSKIAPTQRSTEQSGLVRGCKGNTPTSHKQYNTGNSDTVNNIDPDGDRDARTKAMILLKRNGYSNFQSPDWFADNPEGKVETIEVKNKRPFEPPPFLGQGLDVRQVNSRTKLLESLNIRTVLLVIDPDTGKACWQYLDVLEEGKHFDTSGGQRIYPLDNFNAIQDVPNQNLGGLG